MPETYNYDASDPHAARPYIDINGAIVLVLVIIIVIALARLNVVTSASVDISTAPISTPALPTPAPIYYQPLPTLIPMPADYNAQPIDNSDHRICVIVVNCN